MEEVARWMITMPLGLFWLRLVLANAFAATEAEGDARGTVPLIGGLAGCLALLACPLAGTHLWAWAPAVVDVGTNPLLALAVFRYRAAAHG